MLQQRPQSHQPSAHPSIRPCVDACGAPPRRRALAALGAAPVAAALALAGCALPSAPPVARKSWSGVMTLRVENDATKSFSARFELEGTATEGRLELRTPMGATAALVDWSAAGARLRTPGDRPRYADSVDTLVLNATGTALPVAALFDWLAGVATPVPGWQPDLSQRLTGRLAARRESPPTEFRMILESR